MAATLNVDLWSEGLGGVKTVAYTRALYGYVYMAYTRIYAFNENSQSLCIIILLYNFGRTEFDVFYKLHVLQCMYYA